MKEYVIDYFRRGDFRRRWGDFLFDGDFRRRWGDFLLDFLLLLLLDFDGDLSLEQIA